MCGPRGIDKIGNESAGIRVSFGIHEASTQILGALYAVRKYLDAGLLQPGRPGVGAQPGQK